MELFGAPLVVVVGAFVVGLLVGTLLAKLDIWRGKS
jgi:hypothetical protein